MSRAEQEDVVINLRAQIASLQNRVKELEEENAKLSSRVLNCRYLVEAMGEINQRGDKNRKKKSTADMPGCDTRIMNHHPRRYVALKVMYFGQRFYGFASEAQMDPTVEVCYVLLLITMQDL
uniref:tRNA pseudouridine38/39 synthase isoform X5 n=1 Tax=Rhizophora mucronata TaxID=61149 RepID=A0A2P2LQN0_RHIMU